MTAISASLCVERVGSKNTAYGGVPAIPRRKKKFRPVDAVAPDGAEE